MAGNLSQDRGRVLENIIFLHLRQQPDSQIFYYRTKNNAEVDFLVKQAGKIKLIQVAWTVKDFSTREREISSLFEALKELKLKQGFKG